VRGLTDYSIQCQAGPTNAQGKKRILTQLQNVRDKKLFFDSSLPLVTAGRISHTVFFLECFLYSEKVAPSKGNSSHAREVSWLRENKPTGAVRQTFGGLEYATWARKTTHAITGKDQTYQRGHPITPSQGKKLALGPINLTAKGNAQKGAETKPEPSVRSQPITGLKHASGIGGKGSGSGLISKEERER